MKSNQDFSKNQRWEACVSTWKASGKSARQWCKEHNISPSTFQYWQDKLSSKKLDPTAFIEISAEQSTGVEIRCQGFEIHVGKEFDQTTLSRCLKAIRSSLC
jgi:hypothetical protein